MSFTFALGCACRELLGAAKVCVCACVLFVDKSCGLGGGFKTGRGSGNRHHFLDHVSCVIAAHLSRQVPVTATGRSVSPSHERSLHDQRKQCKPVLNPHLIPLLVYSERAHTLLLRRRECANVTMPLPSDAGTQSSGYAHAQLHFRGGYGRRCGPRQVGLAPYCNAQPLSQCNAMCHSRWADILFVFEDDEPDPSPDLSNKKGLYAHRLNSSCYTRTFQVVCTLCIEFPFGLLFQKHIVRAMPVLPRYVCAGHFRRFFTVCMCLRISDQTLPSTA